MNFKINFLPSYCNGNMSVSISVNDQEKITWGHDEPTSSLVILDFDHDTDINQPFKLRIVCKGKNQNHDTEVVGEKIVKDKAIEIDSIYIDHVPLKYELYLYPYTKDDGQKVHKTLYFGFDGYYELDVSPSFVLWLIDCKSKMLPSASQQSYEDFLSEIMS